MSAWSGAENQSSRSTREGGNVAKEMGLFNTLFLYQPVPHQLEYGHS